VKKIKKFFGLTVVFFICLVATPISFLFGMVYGGIKFVALTWDAWNKVKTKGE